MKKTKPLQDLRWIAEIRSTSLPAMRAIEVSGPKWQAEKDARRYAFKHLKVKDLIIVMKPKKG